jgi:ATP-dependent exoDNAse (exonuclease V) beta subunit
LVPARTVLQPLERALTEAGVPYRVEGGSLVYATQEVRDLVNCLTAIDDPTDDVAVFAALRSPAYACSDVEIARYRLAGGGFNYLSPDVANAEGRVGDGLRSLRAFHERRGSTRLAALVEDFIAGRRLVEMGLYDAGDRNAFRRARFLVEQARAFESGGPESLRAFVDWLERRAGDAVLDQEGAALDDDEDAVRVLTIHGAKGLEFPIVFLAGLGPGPHYSTQTFGHDRRGDRTAVSIGSKVRGTLFTLGPVDEVVAHERDHIIAERNRLLYVAATRARDHLVVSLYHKVNTHDSAARALIDAGARDFAEALPPVAIETGRRDRAFAGLDIEAPAVSDEQFLEARDALVRGAYGRRYTSATALRRVTAADGADAKEERDDETEPWSRGRAGTHLGRAVHAALQSLPWDAGRDAIEAVARAQAVAEAVPAQAERAAELIRRALSSDAAGRARGAGRALREVPFAVRYDAIVLEGFADLVIEGADGLEVVDWKTDAVPAAAVERRMEEYRVQAGLYVLGLEAATGLPVSRVTYVFVDPDEERSMGDPATLAAEARERLRTWSEGGPATET